MPRDIAQNPKLIWKGKWREEYPGNLARPIVGRDDKGKYWSGIAVPSKRFTGEGHPEMPHFRWTQHRTWLSPYDSEAKARAGSETYLRREWELEKRFFESGPDEKALELPKSERRVPEFGKHYVENMLQDKSDWAAGPAIAEIYGERYTDAVNGFLSQVKNPALREHIIAEASKKGEYEGFELVKLDRHRGTSLTTTEKPIAFTPEAKQEPRPQAELGNIDPRFHRPPFSKPPVPAPPEPKPLLDENRFEPAPPITNAIGKQIEPEKTKGLKGMFFRFSRAKKDTKPQKRRAGPHR